MQDKLGIHVAFDLAIGVFHDGLEHKPVAKVAKSLVERLIPFHTPDEEKGITHPVFVAEID